MQILIPAYRPPSYHSTLSSNASIASREANPTVVEPNAAKPLPEANRAARTSPSEAGSPVYDDPRKQAATAKQSADDKNRELTQQLEVQQLSARDREVRAHERAHAAVGGQYASAPTYQYQRGPDGINYAVAGEVSISAGAIAGDPEATIDKAQVVRRAALAPAEPSAQDRQVASQATKMEMDARAELALLQQEARLDEVKAADKDNGDDSSENASTSSISPKSQASAEPDDDSKPMQNLSEIGSIIDRLSESLGQKMMSSNSLQSPPLGRLIDATA